MAVRPAGGLHGHPCCLLQIEWLSQRKSSALVSRMAQPARSQEGPDTEALLGQRALPEGAATAEQQTSQPSSSGPAGKAGAPRSGSAGTSSNVVPRETIARAAISMAAAAGAISADEVKVSQPQQNSWVTASFDDLPDR